MKRLLLILCAIVPTLLPAQDAPTPAPAPRTPAPLSSSAVAKLEKMKPLFDSKTLDGWIAKPETWTVKDGAMASLGAGRGVIYTAGEYDNYRLVFKMRHLSGKPGTTPSCSAKAAVTAVHRTCSSTGITTCSRSTR